MKRKPKVYSLPVIVQKVIFAIFDGLKRRGL
jgi:hypothetical protein